MYVSELEIAPYVIIRTSLFHLNRLWASAFICRHLLKKLYYIYLLFKASINICQLIPDQPPSGPPSSTPTTPPTLHFWPPTFRQYKALVENQTGKTIKTLQDDFKSSYSCHKIVLKSTSLDCSKICSDGYK